MLFILALPQKDKYPWMGFDYRRVAKPNLCITRWLFTTNWNDAWFSWSHISSYVPYREVLNKVSAWTFYHNGAKDFILVSTSIISSELKSQGHLDWLLTNFRFDLGTYVLLDNWSGMLCDVASHFVRMICDFVIIETDLDGHGFNRIEKVTLAQSA